MRMDELLFSWSIEGYESKIYKVTMDGVDQFINRYSEMDSTKLNTETWQQSELKYNSFQAFWKEFTTESHWLNYYPEFVHQDYKTFIRKFLINIDQESLSSSEVLLLDYWIDSIVNED